MFKEGDKIRIKSPEAMKDASGEYDSLWAREEIFTKAMGCTAVILKFAEGTDSSSRVVYTMESGEKHIISLFRHEYEEGIKSISLKEIYNVY